MQEKVRFTNTAGHELAGVIHQPDHGPARATAVFAHCFTCTKNSLAAVHIADALAESGYAVLRFDFTGLGESEGTFGEAHFSASVQDLVDAADWLAETRQAPGLLVGHSLGGTAVLAAAHRVASALAVATIGSPADAEHVEHLLGDQVETIEAEGTASVNLGGQPFRIHKAFLDDVRAQSVREGIRALRKALLVMHAPLDEWVSIDEASRIFGAGLHPKSFISLDDADHLLTRQQDSRYAAAVLAAWATRYLPGMEDEAARFPETRPGTVVVDGATGDGFLVRMNLDGHTQFADEPTAQGGTNRGPSPYELLAAALGACTAMTVNFFARREEIPLEGLEVTVRHDRVHAEDCEACESPSGKVDRLTRSLRLRGELDDAERATLLKIADRCPVHKTLTGEIVVENHPS